MPSLTQQAELALIGALLADQPPPTELRYLRVEDFADRVHATLFDVITDLRHTQPDLTGTDLTAAVAFRVADRGIDTDWLADVRDQCPEPAHAAAYARMVQAAGFRRDVAEHAERITAAAAYTIDVDGQTHLTKLADALARQSEVYAAFHTLDTTKPGPAQAPQADPWRITMEEHLLADLLQHPEQATDIAIFVHRDTFTSGQRRQIFETLVRLSYDGEPVDEVTVCWEMARIRALVPVTPDPPAEPDFAVLHRLATTRTTRSAIETGRDLIADDIRASLTGRLNALNPTHTGPASTQQPTAGLRPNLHPPAPPTTNQPTPRIDR
ncbi:MAG TPA: DnaB-like helicase N-terminal domain-containing protein [Micromonosporaceae bacterium]|nr:DnaB-like helicase N-terminal domain-containing protein [Micromonosporaceae bacterium]